MATSLAATIWIKIKTALTPSLPHTGDTFDDIENVAGGHSTINGQGADQADRCYAKLGTLAAAATDGYNTLAAGSLVDSQAQAIDLDKLKMIVVKCLTGSIKIDAPAANYMGFFGTATDYVPLRAGQTWGLDLIGTNGLGLDVTVNSKFDIVDTFGGAGSTYQLLFAGSN